MQRGLCISSKPGSPLLVILISAKSLQLDQMGDGSLKQIFIEFFTETLFGSASRIANCTLGGVRELAGWMTECVSSHSACWRPEVVTGDCFEDWAKPGGWRTPLPTRVVDVGTEDNNWVPRLYESTPGEEGAYACLSYCWGESVPLTTTVETLAARRQGMAWESLGTMFNHALKVAQCIGVRYIWIDALCIVQDDHRDWEIESGKMADIYGNSIFTIIAAQGDAAAPGFLRTNSTDYFDNYARSWPICRDSAGKITDPDDPDAVRIYARRSLHLNKFDRVIDTRAWTFQEFFLPTRILIFDYSELRWECSTTARCVCSPRATTWALKPMFANYLRQHEGETVSNRKARLFTAWCQLVELYSKRKLTYPSDKLPALSGIARQFEKETGATYLAGIWAEDLHHQLAWRIKEDTLSRRVAEYRAPSWSWASVEGEIEFPRILEMRSDYPALTMEFGPVRRHQFAILEANCTANTLDHTGSVSSGHLRIVGFLCQARYRYVPAGWRSRHFCVREGAECEFFLDFTTYLCPRDTGPRDGGTLYCLQMAWVQAGMHCKLEALVLQRSRRTVGAFERIGIIKRYGDNDLPAGWFCDAELEEINIV